MDGHLACHYYQQPAAGYMTHFGQSSRASQFQLRDSCRSSCSIFLFVASLDRETRYHHSVKHSIYKSLAASTTPSDRRKSSGRQTTVHGIALSCTENTAHTSPCRKSGLWRHCRASTRSWWLLAITVSKMSRSSDRPSRRMRMPSRSCSTSPPDLRPVVLQFSRVRHPLQRQG